MRLFIELLQVYAPWGVVVLAIMCGCAFARIRAIERRLSNLDNGHMLRDLQDRVQYLEARLKHPIVADFRINTDQFMKAFEQVKQSVADMGKAVNPRPERPRTDTSRPEMRL